MMNSNISIGLVTAQNSKVVGTETHTWESLASKVTTHRTTPNKHGAGWLPGPIGKGERVATRMPCWHVLVLDVEAKTEKIKEGEPTPEPGITKRRIGPAAPTVDDVATELDLLGWGGAIATSHSHEEPALVGDVVLTVGPRYRLTFPVSRPILPTEIEPLGLHVAALLGVSDVLDKGCLNAGRFFYLPSAPPDRAGMVQSEIVAGEPLDVDTLLQEAQRAAAVVRSVQRNSPSASVIEAFNNGADVGQLLERYGYKPKGRNRWIWPGSSTGMAGVYLVPGTQRIVSRHSNDPLHADGKSNDAFGVWCVLEHGGDYRKAVKAASKMLGMDKAHTPPATSIYQDFGMVPGHAPAVEDVDQETGEILQRDKPQDVPQNVPLAPAPVFPPLPDTPTPAPAGFEFVHIGQLLGTPAPVEYLVDELIEHPSMGLVFGASGSGKSFATLAMAASVATGTPWLGRDVKQGAVFYLAGEGHAGISRRLKGWALHYGVELENAPLYVSKVPAALMDKASALAVEAAISAMTRATGHSPAMLVIDTLARNIGSGDENSNADIGQFIHHIDALRAKLGATAVVVHHTGHQETGRARGGSALNAAMDVSFLVEAQGLGSTKITQTKAKEAELARPIGIELHGVELPPNWVDGKGRVLQTAVAVLSETGPTIQRDKPLSKGAQTGMDAYCKAAKKAGQWCDNIGEVSVHLEDWRIAFYEISTADEQSAKKVAFQRARDALVKAGRVRVANDVYIAVWGLDNPELQTMRLEMGVSGTRNNSGTTPEQCSAAQPD